MAFDIRTKATKGKVEDGDTLEKIAERETEAGNPITAEEIARFNWGTDDPDIVDEHLRDELGCYKRSPDNRFVISTDTDARTDLLIPRPFKRSGFAIDQVHTIRVKKNAKPPKQFEGCASVRGVCFEYDSSFIRPIVVDDLKILEKLVRKRPDAKIMIFGHTDKVGSERYNKSLSERRALSVYAFITNDVETWESLYKQERWGIRAVQAILDDFGGEFDPGPVDGIEGPQTKAAIKKYQEQRGLTVDGIAGPKTREKLFAEYMTSKHDVELNPDHFMDPKHMGCSEFNPAVETEEPSEPNRRVTFFFFHKDRLPNLPCKRGDLAPCKKQCSQPLPRTKDTFHCSFYDSIAKNCPCEAGTPERGDVPGIDIEVLDKWFIPGNTGQGGETCRIRYSLMGQEAKADKVVFEVYASNYCNAEMKDDGTLLFSKIDPAIPIYSEELPEDHAHPGEQHEIADWSGQSNAADGVLKPGEGQERFVNVVFSPYTVHLRYLEKDATDTEARILLEPFWPQWEKKGGAETLQADSLNIRWKTEKAEKLKAGRLLIFDKTDTVVFEKDLTEQDIKQGEFRWDGKRLDGTEAKPEQLPYRVQIQARTGEDEANGFAIAVMHTEVRLFVDPKTHLATDKDYDPAGDPQSFEIALGALVPQDEAPTRDKGTIWCQYQLARSGFHPGPVDGTHRDEYKLALKELQRSVPKRKANPAASFERLNPDGSESNDTKDSLEDLPPSPLRPWFGDTTTRDDLSNEDAGEVLKDKDKELTVWVDERHAYTESSDPEVSGHASAMSNYRGSMDIGDGRTDKDEKSIARPWLPLKTELSLLSRDAGLDTADRPEVTDAMRRAIGPVRVDWTFDETGPEVSVIDTSKYNKDRTRSKKYVEWVLDELKEEYTRKDVQRKTVYTNCPQKYGGTRPEKANLKEYFKAAFGFGGKRLRPWHAAADNETESIATIVHDDLGQAEDSLFTKWVGRVGVYFNPSRIAGDGYRVRAQVRFKNCSGYDFPNGEVLARRYPRLPQANTAKMRLWRKSSIRAYIRWAPSATGHWDSYIAGYREFYAAAHVHFVHEPDPNTAPPGTATEYNLTDFLDPTKAADVTTFRNIIRNRVTKSYHKNNPGHIKLDASYVFPWYHLPHMDWIWHAPANTAFGDLYDDFYNDIFDATWRKYRERLLNELLRRAEAKFGKLRGHLLVEFRSTPQYWVEEYECDGCGNKYWWIERTSAGGSAVGKNCADCGDQMKRRSPPNVRHPNRNKIPLPAVGVPLAATWLFTSSDEYTWTHEVGHHRHLEHAASAPIGSRTEERKKLHDTETNTHKAWPAGTGPLDKQWDRCCIMSYTSHSEKLYFCGKCILRNRGWKVESLGHPGSAVKDP